MRSMVKRGMPAAMLGVLFVTNTGRAAEPTIAPSGSASAALTTTASGLQYTDFKVGDGASPQPGEIAIVHYTGFLEDGKKFESSRERGKPFGFKVGAGQVIKGWDEGVATMKVGGIRRLVVPPSLAYGEKGAGSVIPPNARLTFDIELIDVRKPPPAVTP